MHIYGNASNPAKQYTVKCTAYNGDTLIKKDENEFNLNEELNDITFDLFDVGFELNRIVIEPKK